METIVDVLSYAGTGAFLLLALVTFNTWRERGGAQAGWAATSFGALGAISLAGLLIPEEHTGIAWAVAIKLVLAALIVFPYLLYRFTAAFTPPGLGTELVASGLTAAAVLYGLAMPSLPEPEDPRPGWLAIFLVLVLVQWTTCSVIAGTRLWRAGGAEPTVARRRMRVLAVGAAGMTVAIILIGLAGSEEVTWVDALVQSLALSSALLFFLGFAPPRLLRLSWRQAESRHLQRVIAGLMGATTEEDVTQQLLPHTARLLAGRGAALVSPDGRVVGTFHVDPAEAAAAAGADTGDQVLRVDLRAGVLLVWTTPYTPFFGDEERELLRSLGGLADLALERGVLFARERSFIANAAHELRTPLAALTGLTSTVAARYDQMSDEQLRQVLDAMDRQGMRAAELIDRLLDLAYVEHSGVEVEPIPLGPAVKRALEGLSRSEGTIVTVGIADDVAVLAEAGRLDQILSNLLTNAFRYGGPSVDVAAVATSDLVLLSIADDGPGIPLELAEDVFEPFTRAVAAPSIGSGLGLAIVKRLVAAFGGTIRYEPATPHGARFEISLRRAS